jgi:hypothetical protein
VQVKRALDTRLALGDLAVLDEEKITVPEFGTYADEWVKDYARMECKSSTADGYESALNHISGPCSPHDDLTRSNGTTLRS